MAWDLSLGEVGPASKVDLITASHSPPPPSNPCAHPDVILSTQSDKAGLQLSGAEEAKFYKV